MNNEENTELMEEGLSMVATISRSEYEAKVDTAKKYKRVLSVFSETLTQYVTSDREIAESCIYSVPRAGKELTGPSVRFAELVASAWGNLAYGYRPISRDAEVVRCQGVCHDMQNNVTSSVEKSRSITGKKGRYNNDMITNAENALGSIVARDSILKIVPKALWQKQYREAVETAVGEGQTFEERVHNAVHVFFGERHKITLKQLNEALGKEESAKEADYTVSDLEQLIGYKNALKDGAKAATLFAAKSESPKAKLPTKPKTAHKGTGGAEVTDKKEGGLI